MIIEDDLVGPDEVELLELGPDAPVDEDFWDRLESVPPLGENTGNYPWRKTN